MSDVLVRLLVVMHSCWLCPGGCTTIFESAADWCVLEFEIHVLLSCSKGSNVSSAMPGCQVMSVGEGLRFDHDVDDCEGPYLRLEC